MYHVVGSGFVGRNGYVIHHGYPEQCFDIGIMGLGLERIPEKDDEVDLPFRYLRADLLVAAERSGELAMHVETGGVRNEFGCRTGAAKLKTREGIAVLHSPAHHFGFLIVVRDERDAFDFFHDPTSFMC